MQNRPKINERLIMNRKLREMAIGYEQGKKNEDDGETETVAENKLCNIFTQDITIKSHTVFLNDLVGDTYYYNKFLNSLYTAKENEIFNIYVNNYGGHLHTTFQILCALHETEANTIGHLDGVACSAAGMIFLGMKEFRISSFGSMMCHYYSGGLYGKGNEMEADIEFSKKHYKKCFTDIYEGFLTPAELDGLFKGVDYWFDGHDVQKRLLRRQKIIMDKMVKKNIVNRKKVKK